MTQTVYTVRWEVVEILDKKLIFRFLIASATGGRPKDNRQSVTISFELVLKIFMQTSGSHCTDFNTPLFRFVEDLVVRQHFTVRLFACEWWWSTIYSGIDYKLAVMTYEIRSTASPAYLKLANKHEHYVHLRPHCTVHQGWHLVSSVPLPLIRSYRIEFYFPRCRFYEAWSSTYLLGRRKTRPLAHWACRAIRERQRRLRNGVTERKYGHGFTETVTEADTDERKRKAGNHAWAI